MSASPATRPPSERRRTGCWPPVGEVVADLPEQRAAVDAAARRARNDREPTVFFDPRRMLTYLDGRIARLRFEIAGLADDDPDLGAQVMQAAALHERRALRTGDTADVDDALFLVDAVLAGTPREHVARPSRLNLRAQYLHLRAQLAADPKMLTQAVDAARVTLAEGRFDDALGREVGVGVRAGGTVLYVRCGGISPVVDAAGAGPGAGRGVGDGGAGAGEPPPLAAHRAHPLTSSGSANVASKLARAAVA